MNIKQVIAVSALAVVGASAFAAEDVRWPDASVQVSQNTREQVKADLREARAENPNFEVNEGYSVPDTPVASVRSRAEVRAEAREAARDFRSDEQVERDAIQG